MQLFCSFVVSPQVQSQEPSKKVKQALVNSWYGNSYHPREFYCPRYLWTLLTSKQYSLGTKEEIKLRKRNVTPCLFVYLFFFNVSVKNASINHLNLITIIFRTQYFNYLSTMNKVLIRKIVSLYCHIAEPLPDK